MSALASPWGVGPFEGVSASGSADSLSPFACARPNAFAACGRISTSSGSGAGTHYECLAYSPRQVSSSGGSSQYTNTLYNSGSDDEEEDEPSSPTAAPADAPWCCTATRLVSLSSCASAFASACPSPRPVPSSPRQQPCTPTSTTIGRDTPATPATTTSSSADPCCCCLSPRTEAQVAAAFGRFDWASEPEWSALRDAQMRTLEHFGLIHWTLSDLHDAQLAEAFASVDWAALAATSAAACVSATATAAAAIAAATTTSSCEFEVEAPCEDFGLLREAADEAVLALLSPAHQRGYRLAAADVVLMCADMADLEACGLVGWTPKRLALDTAFRRLVLKAPAAEAEAGEAAGSSGDSCCGSPCCTSAGGSSYSPCSTSTSTRGSCGAWWLADEEDEAVQALVFGEGELAGSCDADEPRPSMQ